MNHKKFPCWLRKRHLNTMRVEETRSLLEEYSLNTVCQSAQCPNTNECFHRGRATFLILGTRCTRNCAFCGVKKELPENVDKDEPRRIASVIEELGLDYAIITSVTRDDLPDGGARHFARCIVEIRKRADVKVEVLIPDFKGDNGPLETVLLEKPDVLAHNIETVPRLYERLRPEADYKRSLDTLKKAHKSGADSVIKSGLMVGLGEKEKEVYDVMSDLRSSGCAVITIGQYLRPSKGQIEVSDFIHPSIFERYKKKAFNLGFKNAACGPFARSSYV